MPRILQSTFPAFAFEGLARHRRGWHRQILISVQPPYSDRPEEFVCPVHCSLISEKAYPIRAGEPQHAYSLAFRFLRQMLSDFSLFALDGTRFDLPRIAPWEDDWKAHDPPPEQGFRMFPTAVGPAGKLGLFFVSVSAPRRVDGGYEADVYYGTEERPATLVRAMTLPEAYYAGIDWLHEQLQKDRITLLDCWNEPSEIPKRPLS